MNTFLSSYSEKIKIQLRERKFIYSLLCSFGLIALSTLILSMHNSGETYSYSVGDIASEEIRASRDIVYSKESETEYKKNRISQSVPLVFDRDLAVLDGRLKLIDQLFRHVKSASDEADRASIYSKPYRVMLLGSRLPKYLQFNRDVLTELVSYGDTEQLKRVISQTLIQIYDNREVSILEEPYRNPLKLENKNISIRIIDNSGSEEISGIVEDLYTVPEIAKRVQPIVNSIAPGLEQSASEAVNRIVISTLKPNTVFNRDETERRIAEATKSVKNVVGVLKKGQIIAREGDTITLERLGKIGIINKSAESSNISYVLGVFVVQLIFLFLLRLFFVGYERVLVPDKKSSMIVFILLTGFMIFSYVIMQADSVRTSGLYLALFFPIPFIAMMIGVLYNIFLGLIMSLHMIFFTAMITNGDVASILIAVASAVAGVFVNQNVHRRTDFLKGGFFIGLINSIVALTQVLIQEQTLNFAVMNIELAMASGMICSILALGLFPLFEGVFDVTTRFKLLELADLNADIFKKMLLEAPGTYHHSLIVSNMAETACKDIKADHLLARVGAFYHDIGKIEDAGMYIENKVTDPRAKTLSPKYYSKLIISHVDKGIKLAHQHKLPQSVIDFIQEHHGQTTMSFFYHKALETASESDNDEEVDKAEFQYPGPKPSSRETAVVMLADAIEAASRSIQDPTQLKLEGLVTKIIYNKLNEGELENTPLSMTDLNVIKNSFLSILNGIYHTRIEYPETDDVQRLEERLKQRETVS